jgi:anti-sigma B factor antagonist
MRLNAQIRGEMTVITFDGSLDSGTAPSVHNDIERLVPETGTTILDFSKMTYMSSAGLRVLLLVHRRAQRSGARIVLTGLIPDVREVMSATGFLDFFEVANGAERDTGIPA